MSHTITLESLDVESSYLYMHRHIGLILGEFVYEGHRVKVKVIGAKKVENSYPRNVKLRSAITPVLSNTQP